MNESAEYLIRSERYPHRECIQQLQTMTCWQLVVIFGVFNIGAEGQGVVSLVHGPNWHFVKCPQALRIHNARTNRVVETYLSDSSSRLNSHWSPLNLRCRPNCSNTISLFFSIRLQSEVNGWCDDIDMMPEGLGNTVLVACQRSLSRFSVLECLQNESISTLLDLEVSSHAPYTLYGGETQSVQLLH